MHEPPRFALFEETADPRQVLLVDGTASGFRSLSHWPGNSTPARLKRDLSTGIALAWAQLSDAERSDLLGPFEVVANNHYDSDGVLSAFVVLNPEQALEHEALLLDTAAAGDFCVWRGRDALAIDLSLLAFSSHAESPALTKLGASPTDRERWAAAYAFSLAELPALLADPRRHEALFREEERRILEQLDQVEDGRALEVQRFPDEDLAVVTTRLPLEPVPLHHACGDLHRVLVVHPGEDGPRYRFCYRDESWFELVEKRPLPLPRLPLDALRDELAAREGEHADARWWSEGLAAPVARLGFGREGPPSGFFLDLELADEAPSRLAPELVLERLRDALRADV